MLVAIYLFDGVTALDAVGPYEALSRDPEVDMLFVGKDMGVVRTGAGSLGLVVDRRYRDLAAAEVLIIPGGDADGLRAAAADRDLLEWLAKWMPHQNGRAQCAREPFCWVRRAYSKGSEPPPPGAHVIFSPASAQSTVASE